LISDSLSSALIYINQAGQIALYPFPPPATAERIYDSRHVHVDYAWNINVATSTSDRLMLEFDRDLATATTTTIIMAENMQAGQLYWEGEINVNGDIQQLIIQTHRLNNPDTQFCIHRPGDTNNKSLDIDIKTNAETIFRLVSFSADGATEGHDNPIVWQ